MGRTSKNIKLRIPEKPRNIKGFRTGSYRVATTISSLVRTWYFRVCCGRWRQFWKRRKSLCCNGFRTRRPVLTSFISEKTRVQIEMESAPKRSIFCALARKYARRKPLSGMALRTVPPDEMQEKPTQNRLYEAPFRTEAQKGVFVMKYDAKEFKKYPEIMNKEQMRIACHISPAKKIIRE